MKKFRNASDACERYYICFRARLYPVNCRPGQTLDNSTGKCVTRDCRGKNKLGHVDETVLYCYTRRQNGGENLLQKS